MTSVSMLALIESGAAELLPGEFGEFVESICENGDDAAPKLLFADWLAEKEEPELEYTFRWMAKHGKHPKRSHCNGAAQWYWGHISEPSFSHELPTCLISATPEGVAPYHPIHHATYLLAAVYLSKRLEYLRAMTEV